MRYFDLILKTTADYIAANTKIKLRDYDYDNILGAVNNYLFKTSENDYYLFLYRETADTVLACLGYDEKKTSCQEAVDYYKSILQNTFNITHCIEDLTEITMFSCLDHLLEARRRGCNGAITLRYTDNMHLWIYHYREDSSKHSSYRYTFTEKIISDQQKKNTIYDKDFLAELSNIEQHANESDFTGNMVHYVISSRSPEAAGDMTETLMQYLLKANRISSRRMEMISEINPDVYKIENHIEDTIENNRGGVVVFDLSEKFGNNPTEYSMTARYLETLVKTYRNKCLFVFTYNMDKPGFAYKLLPELKKYIIPVVLREGTGDRKAAVAYLEELVRNSEYSQYTHQVGEFMEQYSEDTFSQTDVLMAYEQFGAWCINKNVLHAYHYDPSGDFFLDRDENVVSAYDTLHKMTGLDAVKTKIDHIIAGNIIEKERKKCKGKLYTPGTMHMIFGGNPGTAKTTVAKLFAGIAKEKKLIKSGIFVERGGMDLDGMFSAAAIRNAFDAAKGGVLFVDEAYSMRSDSAVTVFIQEMENHRHDVIVILAGYNERMQQFLELNEGLKSRIPYWVEFPDYNAQELTDIFKSMAAERGFDIADDALQEAEYCFDQARTLDNFGNGRYVRNFLDEVIQKQSVRLFTTQKNATKIPRHALFLITKEDVSDDIPREQNNAKEELENMIGLSNVKSVINKAIASYKLKKLCMEKGLSKEKPSLHMVFTGNPGTAKTTVARLFAQIMKEEKILSSGKFVETGRADLIGSYVGQTAPLVRKKFKEAQGGVLFIDEAYSLCDAYENGYGDEAINTIVQEMENHRDDVIVIFAGYPDPMKQFLKRNPGMLSRIAYQVEFEDYTTDELCEITKLMLKHKQMTITDSAMAKLRTTYEHACHSTDYGNGRFVRKLLEDAEMNLAERLMQVYESDLSLPLLSTIEECDIPENTITTPEKKRPIGFCGYSA